MKPSATPLSLKARALRHLARREHTRAELERKLTAPLRARPAAEGRAGPAGRPAAPAPPADAADAAGAADVGDVDDVDGPVKEQVRRVLDEFVARGLLCDERAAESLLAAHAQRYGSRRLERVLQVRGVAPELVRTMLQHARRTELERAQDLWRRRFGAVPADAKERARQMRFLAGRGFDADVIRRVVKGEPQDDESA